ncbi:MAG: GNAT family N-acetyltransferase [Defluviitaleaceae bacterium]|nr:GNAT family N-acetyltransferase [Defluviitaleaceae bacterium]
MKIVEYNESNRVMFEKLFEEYFIDELKIDNLAEGEFESIFGSISQHVKEGICFLDLLMIDGSVKGFINYQVDSERSNWCIKEGHGCIRELYIMPDFRKFGYGKELVVHAEKRLMGLSVSAIYLTSEANATSFWAKMGYRDMDEICARNNQPIFEKEV